MTMAKNTSSKGKNAKASKTTKAAEKPAKDKAASAPEFKYGVSDLAEVLGIKPASVRVGLRKAGIEKAGRSYGWNTKADLNAVADQLKKDSKESASED